MMKTPLEDLVEKILEIFQARVEDIRSSGWLVGDPESPTWWGGLQTRLEIVLTAVLVKLSRWSSARAALEGIREAGLLDLEALSREDPERVAELIRGVGFPTSKASTIAALSKKIKSLGGVEALERLRPEEARRILMDVEGIGPETADSILLFALNKPVFPATRLSRRVLERLGAEIPRGYEGVRRAFEEILGGDLYRLKLLHAGLTAVASRYCRASRPRCGLCILRDVCQEAARRSPATAPLQASRAWPGPQRTRS